MTCRSTRGVRVGEAGPRLGFRFRLALVFFSVFVLAATILLIIECAVVAALFDSSIASEIVAVPETGFVAVDSSSSMAEPPTVTVSVIAAAQAETRDEVLGGLIFWSAVTLVVFCLAGCAIAWWITGRSLRRLRDVTTLARAISQSGDRLDLAERLDLDGPQDEIRQLADSFDGMLDRLQRAFESQSVFVANASHELRTPLAIARTSLEVTLRKDAVPAPLRPALERALRANLRSESLLDSLLALASASASVGRAISERGLLSLAEDEWDAVAELARILDVTLICRVDPALHVWIDVEMLRLVVSNLIRNSVTYNTPGGFVWIEVDWHPESVPPEEAGARHLQNLVLRISNTGSVIDDPPAHLLKPFHRGRSSRLASPGASPGSGLGLAIANAAAESFDGRLRLTARREGGLRAEVFLPGDAIVGPRASPPQLIE